jgi:Holliday junction DNA helicase RuvA
MIASLSGLIIDLSPAHCVIECHGVGYWVNISLYTYEAIQGKKEIRLLTHLHFSENLQQLFGFSNALEKELFLMLISVSGIGPSTARMAISSYPAGDILQAIAREDEAMIRQIKGVGPKSAKRIILELKDKAGKNSESVQVSADPGNNLKQEALFALIALGFQKPAAEKAIEKAMKEGREFSQVEELIKFTLKIL